MKRLFENWRQYVDEAANVDYKKYCLHMLEGSNAVTLVIYDGETLLRTLNSKEKLPAEAMRESVKGALDMVEEDWAKGKCFQKKGKFPYVAHMSVADDKLGPMLYDWALSKAYADKSPGLIPDRSSVSQDASRIYSKWEETGRGATGIPVKSQNVDDIKGRYTEPEHDDCSIVHHQFGDPENKIYSTTKISKGLYYAQIRSKSAIKEIAQLMDWDEEDVTDALLTYSEDLFSYRYHNR